MDLGKWHRGRKLHDEKGAAGADLVTSVTAVKGNLEDTNVRGAPEC